ncbi:MAG: hypothetical protein H7A45_04230 [Verrucomicrobiales bacterium]|nr:hypothetical protein [Verrucomicrobiales bacterium]MCP5528452.1 hypothetical protein [Verrucomicrobiales bacterium]
MKSTLACIAASAAILGGPATQAENLILNGGFEPPADYDNWIVDPYAAFGIGWYLNDGTYLPLSGIFGAADPLAGAQDLMTDSLGAGTMTLGQWFEVPTGVQSAILSWQDRIRSVNFDGGDFLPGWQEVRVVIRDLDENEVAVVFATDPGDGAVQPGPNLRGADLTSVLQAYEGQALLLSFEVQAYLGFVNFSVDDVILAVTTDGGGGGDNIVIDGCDTGVPNLTVDGVSLQTYIDDCAAAAKNHGQFVKCVAQVTNLLVKEGLITGEQKGAIQSCAGQSDLP